jgi:hypothetical protein
MAPFLVFALALLGAEEPPTASVEPAPPPAAAAPAAAPMGASPIAPPTDDYGYVAWCYGAISGYVELYDRAMPDVIRIERAWPTPSTEENINEVYPGQKKESETELKLFRRAMTAAEKASAQPIQTRGMAAIKRGRAVWTGSDTVTTAQLAQFWMSWTPPAKCEETARSLEKKAKLFGQALTYNTGPEPEAAPPADAAAPEPLDLAAAPVVPPAADAQVAGDVMGTLTGGSTPAPEAPAADAEKPTESSADDASAPDLPVADKSEALSQAPISVEPASDAPAADPPAPTLDLPLEPQVVTEPATPDSVNGVPEAIAPTPKGDAASATGFKPRKKKPDLRGPQ